MDTEQDEVPVTEEPGVAVSAEEDGGVIEPISEDAAVQELGGILEKEFAGDDETPKGSAPTGETKPPAKGKKGKTSASQTASAVATAAKEAAGDEEEETPPEPETETLPETLPAETPPETEPAPATTEDALDLSKWDLPAETAAEIQESFNRAMSKKHRRLTREREQREQLEEELSTTREEVQSLKAAGDTKVPRGGAGLGTPYEVEMASKIAEWQQGIAFCEAHEVEGWTGNSKGVEVTYTPEQLRASKRVYEKELVKAEIRMEDFQAGRVEQRKKFDADAITEHPWLKNASDGRTQTINQVVATFPVLREIPGMRLILARAFSYQAGLKGQPAPTPGANGPAKTPAAAAPGKPPPKLTTRPGSAPPAMPAGRAKQDAAWKALETNPSDQTAVELLKTIVD